MGSVLAWIVTPLGLATLAFAWAWRSASPTAWTGELLQLMRSSVRIVVTIAATAYMFGGIAVLVWLYCGPKDATSVSDASRSEVHNLFMIGVPLASGVIGYWFASRSAEKHLDQSGGPENDDQRGGDRQGGHEEHETIEVDTSAGSP